LLVDVAQFLVMFAYFVCSSRHR